MNSTHWTMLCAVCIMDNMEVHLPTVCLQLALEVASGMQVTAPEAVSSKIRGQVAASLIAVQCNAVP